jgi:hypothetical protein
MVRAKNKVLEAFMSPEGKIIAEFLEECMDDKVARTLEAEDVQMYRAQGAALELIEIVDLAKDALNRLHSS